MSSRGVRRVTESQRRVTYRHTESRPEDPEETTREAMRSFAAFRALYEKLIRPLIEGRKERK